jgi:hypothetical protein
MTYTGPAGAALSEEARLDREPTSVNTRQLPEMGTYLVREQKTDNEKTVTVEHVSGIAVRKPTIVEVFRHYGLTIATCEPADPQSKGGSEATVKIAKADLVATEHNLRESTRDDFRRVALGERQSEHRRRNAFVRVRASSGRCVGRAPLAERSRLRRRLGSRPRPGRGPNRLVGRSRMRHRAARPGAANLVAAFGEDGLSGA